ncbi:MAG: DUF177 domain-containing protein [Holophagaceae bacterium]|nr:DUF177 domain-containing protein [Holophagaceae bacterium]
MIHLSKLPAEGLKLSGDLALLPLEGEDAVRDMAWSIFILPSSNAGLGDTFFDVKGSGVLDCTCSRCLEPFDLPLAVSSQYLGSKDAELVARGAHALGTQDLDVVFMPEDELDEEALVKEQFQLQVPMHPLCKEDCLGLCPDCGKNWNKGKCSCNPELRAKEPSALAKALGSIKLDFTS